MLKFPAAILFVFIVLYSENIIAQATRSEIGCHYLYLEKNGVPAGGNNKWVDVAKGYQHSLGLKSDGTLWGWEERHELLNVYGKLKDSALYGNPVQIGTERQWLRIIAGQFNSFALKSDSTLWAWGGNWNGQLGDGTHETRTSPVQIGMDKWITVVTKGLSFSCGLKSDSTLWAWGSDSVMRSNNEIPVGKLSPVRIGNNKWINISGGNNHILGVNSNGSIWVFGNTQSKKGVHIMKPVVQIGTDRDWAKVFAGNGWDFGIKKDRTLWAWGDNLHGTLGDNTGINRKNPVQIGTDKWISVM